MSCHTQQLSAAELAQVGPGAGAIAVGAPRGGAGRKLPGSPVSAAHTKATHVFLLRVKTSSPFEMTRHAAGLPRTAVLSPYLPTHGPAQRWPQE